MCNVRWRRIGWYPSLCRWAGYRRHKSTKVTSSYHNSADHRQECSQCMWSNELRPYTESTRMFKRLTVRSMEDNKQRFDTTTPALNGHHSNFDPLSRPDYVAMSFMIGVLDWSSLAQQAIQILYVRKIRSWPRPWILSLQNHVLMSHKVSEATNKKQMPSIRVELTCKWNELYA